MIAIICRSAYLASAIAVMLPGEDVQRCTAATSAEGARWLAALLSGTTVSVVLYEPCFFIDPAPYRSMSPATRFIILAGPGEEPEGLRALSCGAAAFLGKPFDTSAINGVLKLVSL